MPSRLRPIPSRRRALLVLAVTDLAVPCGARGAAADRRLAVRKPAEANWASVQAITLILAVAVPVLARDVSSLTALWLGEANAASLGLDIERRRRRSFVLVALLTAGAVSFTGTIGFIGLIAPQVARGMVGEDHRFALPLAMIMGAGRC
ncbi:iron ABC transporter permease [Cereibacter azotoformans]|nr:iron chelate uptake ABC transporter family permease subunit [Cereibacter azotoformans]ULB11647.1 iron ABC transporter permease [Cereibacter azotoformans]